MNYVNCIDELHYYGLLMKVSESNSELYTSNFVHTQWFIPSVYLYTHIVSVHTQVYSAVGDFFFIMVYLG